MDPLPLPTHVSIPSDLWEQLLEFVNQQVDVRDGSDGKQLPNEAMILFDRMEKEVVL